MAGKTDNETEVLPLVYLKPVPMKLTKTDWKSVDTRNWPVTPTSIFGLCSPDPVCATTGKHPSARTKRMANFMMAERRSRYQ